mgnify:CR=1 FL=1
MQIASREVCAALGFKNTFTAQSRFAHCSSTWRRADYIGHGGYATSIGDIELGLNAIAVPVRNSAGEVNMALGLSVPASRKSELEMIADFLPKLRAAAAELSSFH